MNADRSGGGTGAKAQDGTTAQVWHAGHHKTPLVSPRRRDSTNRTFVRKGNVALVRLAA
jgi:hypothetical protein